MKRATSGLGRVAVLGLASLVLVACGGGGSKGPNSSGLLVIDTIPIDGGQLNPVIPADNPRSHEVQILFSANPDPATVLDAAEFNGLHANIRFIDSSLTRIPGRAFLGGVDALGRTPQEIFPNIDAAWAEEIANDADSVLRFIYDTDGSLTLSEALPPEQYTIVVNDQVTNVSGSRILERYCGSFTSGPDTYPPVVRFTSPSNNATDVPLTEPFVVEFNEGVLPSTVIGSPPGTSPGIQLLAQATGGAGTPGLPITGTITRGVSNTCVYTFTPSSPMPGAFGGIEIIISAIVNPPTPPPVPLGFPPNPPPAIPSDAAGNLMAAASTTTFRTTEGPTISNNPVPPNALWFGSTSPNAVGVVGINPNGITLVETDGDGTPTSADDNVVVASSINQNIGTPEDIVLGNFVTVGHALDDPPIPNPPPPIPLGNTTTFQVPSVCGGKILPNLSNSDLGSYVYVADSTENSIRVLNSNTSLEVDRIPVPDPVAVTLSQNVNTMFVANFGTNSVSVINVARNANQLIKEVSVNPSDSSLRIGRGPSALSSQPDMEDVLVINKRDETMSIMSYGRGFEVRKVVASNIGPDPVDVVSTWRGGTYFAYITNRQANSISVFESGPNFPVNLGPDDIKAVLEGSAEFNISSPTKATVDLTTGIQGDGVYYVNSDDGSVGKINLIFLGPPPNPYFPNPAPSRVWGQTSITPPFGRVLDIALADNVNFCSLGVNSNLKNAFGQFGPPIRAYLSTGSSIRAFDPRNALDLGIEIPVPGVRVLATYFKN